MKSLITIICTFAALAATSMDIQARNYIKGDRPQPADMPSHTIYSAM
jgi:hypothetical protein